MSSENLKYYRRLMNEKNKILSIGGFVDYNLINFIAMIVLLLINLFFINLIRSLSNEVDMLEETPSDYTLMISDIPRNIENSQDLKANVLNLVILYLF
jgi:hypothetical protein